MSKKKVAKKEPKNITIPFHLAKILAADKSDVKHSESFEEMVELGKSLLRLLMEIKK